MPRLQFGTTWVGIGGIVALIAVLGMGIFCGNSGILSFGHLAFMGIGAYVSGGLGSLTGAVAGGFALGFIEIHLTAFLPENVHPFRESLALGLVILVLLWRPNGLIPAVSLGKEKV